MRTITITMHLETVPGYYGEPERQVTMDIDGLRTITHTARRIGVALSDVLTDLREHLNMKCQECLQDIDPDHWQYGSGLCEECETNR